VPEPVTTPKASQLTPGLGRGTLGFQRPYRPQQIRDYLVVIGPSSPGCRPEKLTFKIKDLLVRPGFENGLWVTLQQSHLELALEHSWQAR